MDVEYFLQVHFTRWSYNSQVHYNGWVRPTFSVIFYLHSTQFCSVLLCYLMHQSFDNGYLMLMHFCRPLCFFKMSFFSFLFFLWSTEIDMNTTNHFTTRFCLAFYFIARLNVILFFCLDLWLCGYRGSGHPGKKWEIQFGVFLQSEKLRWEMVFRLGFQSNYRVSAANRRVMTEVWQPESLRCCV